MAVDFKWILNKITEQDRTLEYFQRKLKEHEARISRLETLVDEGCRHCWIAKEEEAANHQGVH
jgi:hypothetical protein